MCPLVMRVCMWLGHSAGTRAPVLMPAVWVHYVTNSEAAIRVNYGATSMIPDTGVQYENIRTLPVHSALHGA
eukprot:707773-Pyramimonas_sp.AAC.1